MGNQPLCVSKTDKDFSSKDFYFVRTINHHLLGELQELQGVSSNENVYLKIIQIQKMVHDTDIEFIRKRTKVKHPNLLRVFSITSSYEEIAESPITTIYLHFEAFDRSIGDEIRLKKSNAQTFTEIELMLYLKNCIDVLALFQEKSYVHGNITPETILFTRQNQLKVADSTLLGSLMLPGLLKLETDHLGKYKAPELMQGDIVNHSISKGDVFSLGMTFLQAALLKDVSDCYKLDGTFDFEKLDILQNEVESEYPNNLSKLLKNMLKINEGDRPDFIFLRNFFTELSHDKEISRSSIMRASVDAKQSISAEKAKRAAAKRDLKSTAQSSNPEDDHEHDDLFDIFTCCGGRKQPRVSTQNPPIDSTSKKIWPDVTEFQSTATEEKTKKAGVKKVNAAVVDKPVEKPSYEIPKRSVNSYIPYSYIPYYFPRPSLSPEKNIKIYHKDEVNTFKEANTNSADISRYSEVLRSSEYPKTELPRYTDYPRYNWDPLLSYQPKPVTPQEDNRSRMVQQIIDDYKAKRLSISANINPIITPNDTNEPLRRSYYISAGEKIPVDDQRLSLYENWYNQRLTNLIKDDLLRKSTNNVIQTSDL